MQKIILLHGYGANENDLKPLADFLKTSELQEFHFFKAPLTIPGMPEFCRAWFPITQKQFESFLASNSALSGQSALELEQALESVDSQLKALNIDEEDEVVIGGFSQGSMCSLFYYAKYFKKIKIKKLVLLSSHILDRDFLGQYMGELENDLPVVFQSHGIQDPVLAYTGATQLKDFLIAKGFKLNFFSFPGGHEIPMNILIELKNFLIKG
jgi:phospholipase/carboxylesterase